MERRIVAWAVHELVGKVCLLVHAFTDDREHQFATVRQRDVHPIAQFQLVQIEKDCRSVSVVHVAEDDRGAFLARRPVTVVPTRFGEVRRHVDGPVLVESQDGKWHRDTDNRN